MDDLLPGLKDLGIGCYWDGFFVGAACYANDVALLAPSPSALCCTAVRILRALKA